MVLSLVSSAATAALIGLVGPDADRGITALVCEVTIVFDVDDSTEMASSAWVATEAGAGDAAGIASALEAGAGVCIVGVDIGAAGDPGVSGSMILSPSEPPFSEVARF